CASAGESQFDHW
nr:immunoglobulin heavy chain junction region [Macaca mulatta]